MKASVSSLTSPNVGISFCKTCIDFADQALQILLDEILQIGVLGSCGEVCALVQQKIPSQIVGVVYVYRIFKLESLSQFNFYLKQKKVQHFM